MMVIFPFEAPFYRARNVAAEFVGHPLAYLPIPTTTREAYAAAHGLHPAKQWIALLPGSRSKEIQANLPAMLEAAKHLATHPQIPECFLPKRDPSVRGEFHLAFQSLTKRQNLAESFWQFILPVANTVDSATVQSIIDQHEPMPPIHLVPDAREALHHARASVVASGTATVQAAVIGNPFVVVYKVSPLTFAAAKHLIRYPAEIPAQQDAHGNLPIAMVNLIAGRRIVPELIQQQFTAANVAAALRPLLADTPERAQQLADLAEVRSHLIPDIAVSPIQQVADAVEALLHQHTPPSGRIPSTRV